jgi:ABC-2 type transport system ATP-binding protein
MAALLHDPKVLILDEPFVGLDPKATYELKEKLKSLCESKGLIVFFSSHVLDVVEKFCNKISIIKNGKIVESGETQVVKGEGSLEDKFMEIFNE